MGNFEQVGDAALADVLGDINGPSDPNDGGTAAVAGSLAPVVAADEAADAPLDLHDAGGDTHTPEPLCDEATALGLVEQVRSALEQFDHGIQQIVRLRAWEPLGYESPREFVLAEFGPSDDASGEGRVSRVHAYRLARLATFMYGLASMVGDEVAFDVTERSIRALPQGPDGENHQILSERIAARIEQRKAELGEVPPHEEVQQITDEEFARAKEEIAQRGQLRRAGDEADDADDFDYGRLDSIAVDPSALSEDPIGQPFDGDGYADDEGDFGADGSTAAKAGTSRLDDDAIADDEDPTESGTDRRDLASAYAAADAGDDAIQMTHLLSELIRGLQALADVEEHIPAIVDYADDNEVSRIRDLSERAKAAAAGLLDASGDRDNGLGDLGVGF